MLLLSHGAMAQDATTKEPWAEYDSHTKTLTFKYGVKPTTTEDGVRIYSLSTGFYQDWNSPFGSSAEDIEKDIHADLTKVVFEESFKDARPTICSMWFSGCSNLENIEGLEYLNTENVAGSGFAYMFYGCSKLQTLNVSHFNTANATRMDAMFSGCTSLTELDLSSFDTSKIKDDDDLHSGFWYIFSGCTNLNTIYVSDKFVTNSTLCWDNPSMFEGCTSLRGAAEYNASNTTWEMANSETGYFSKAYALVGDTKVPLAGEETFAWELPLVDGCNFTTPEPFTAKTATYERNVKNAWSLSLIHI